MECHQVNRKTPAVPEIGEIVLIVGDEKNRGEWKKAKVVRYVKGKDGMVRGVVMLYKGHHIERPSTDMFVGTEGSGRSDRTRTCTDQSQSRRE